MKLISGRSNSLLACSVAKYLGIKLTDSRTHEFNDKEIIVEIQETVRGKDVFILQSTSSPANDHLMELLITIDTLKRSSARRITAVIPYFGYARQDRKTTIRSPITAKLVANLLTTAGADRLITFDLHTPTIEGFFDIPTDNLSLAKIFCDHIKNNYHLNNLMIVSPDIGGVQRARVIAEFLGIPLAVVDKRRPKPGEAEVVNVIGHVEGKKCILIDDIIDSGQTLCHAAEALREHGAINVHAYVSHGVLSSPAHSNIDKSPLEKLVISDSIYHPSSKEASSKITILNTGNLLGEAIKRIHHNHSISDLFSMMPTIYPS